MSSPNFKETQAGLIRPPAGAIKVDALPDVKFTGEVTSCTRDRPNFSLIPPQNATGNFTKIVPGASECVSASMPGRRHAGCCAGALAGSRESIRAPPVGEIDAIRASRSTAAK